MQPELAALVVGLAVAAVVAATVAVVAAAVVVVAAVVVGEVVVVVGFQNPQDSCRRQECCQKIQGAFKISETPK